ncbi:phosphoglycerol transferase MdoB-like AlkP superfamily enzyme [Marinobacter sp. LV10R520-4]|uniref:LTA synthase family protein n=1 Tax=Marinobacter sp. LV10R520-4 TaxID=1761796 RepID=UPI000C01CECA|nr:LTA synthase family protein [Marinobacter sp. LV10R520-4]PFG54428.1 phosphoglycerol transferase MdoB-like AlkP superfamily enzyme [Marinobacter sp. LV10R520-4]
MSIRSTTGHRPANPAMFALTSDALVNSLIINSTWSVAFAIYNLKHEADASARYGDMKMADILAEVRSAPWLSGSEFNSSPFPTLHSQTPVQQRQRPLNLVIVLEESLGATFVESFGGTPVTPRLEALKESGWWFENLYATGTRSVRGIEAVVSGYLPSPARSVVKLSLSQTEFFTLGELLKQKDYDTGFIYGGETHFDNMRSFFAGNGFDTIVGQQDYTAPSFTGSWGVSDEDLFAKVHEDIQKLHASGEPFFRLVFSSSNHTPFEYPDNRIEQYDEEKNTVNNAVKYADHALGQFIDTARNSVYWKDTVFLIVADHDARVWGDELVPIKNFQIPGLILGADIESRRIKTITSQVDLAPTLLSLMGITSEHPMVGRDLVRFPDQPGRAMMQFNDYYAWMDENYKVTVLRPDQKPLAGAYSRETGSTEYLEDVPEDMAVRKALAHALLPLELYRERAYGLPD